MKQGEANAVMACVECGAHGALPFKTTKAENPGRLLRLCIACLNSPADWNRFGLVSREPFPGEGTTTRPDGLETK